MDVTIRPRAGIGLPAMVTLAPAGSGLLVDNRIRTTAPGPTGTGPSIEVRRLAGSPRLELRGSVPLGSAPGVRAVSVDNPTIFFVTALRDALVANGIDVRGPAVDIDDLADAPSPAGVGSRQLPVAAAVDAGRDAHEGEPEPVRGNVPEDDGWGGGGPGGSHRGDDRAGPRGHQRSMLQGWGVPARKLIQKDGSGLSRYDYVTADALAGVLAHVERDIRLRGPFEASLPIAGRDGTLAGRMKGTPAEGNARAKTGSMSNVRALSGYVTTADGEPLVFSILANNFDTPPDQITRTIDAIVVRLAGFSAADPGTCHHEGMKNTNLARKYVRDKTAKSPTLRAESPGCCRTAGDRPRPWGSSKKNVAPPQALGWWRIDPPYESMMP